MRGLLWILWFDQVFIEFRVTKNCLLWSMLNKISYLPNAKRSIFSFFSRVSTLNAVYVQVKIRFLPPGTTGNQRPTTNLHHGTSVPAALTVALSAHWIFRNNPTGGMAYGHGHWGRQRLSQNKSNGKIFYLAFLILGAKYANSCRGRLTMVAETAPNGPARLRGATNR